jgi:hypothetical protein
VISVFARVREGTAIVVNFSRARVLTVTTRSPAAAEILFHHLLLLLPSFFFLFFNPYP